MAVGDFEPRLNVSKVAEHVAHNMISLEDTLWQDVMRLPPANAMWVTADGPRVFRYWLPPLDAPLRYSREEDYVEHYRELLADSVRRASRTHLPLGCEVSGGLDLSAVFAIAHRDLQAGRLPAPSLHGYTYSFPPGGPEDEIEFAEAVGQHLGVNIAKIKLFLPNIDRFVERSRADCDMPIYANIAMSVNIGKAAATDGARVVLNGEGGDNFLCGLPYYFSEHLMERDWRSLFRSAREDASELGWLRTLNNVWRFGNSGIAGAGALAQGTPALSPKSLNTAKPALSAIARTVAPTRARHPRVAPRHTDATRVTPQFIRAAICLCM